MERPKPIDSELITKEESKLYLGKFNLDDERIEVITNNMIGIIDSIINSYLENF